MTPIMSWNALALRPKPDRRHASRSAWPLPMVVVMRIDRWDSRHDGSLSEAALRRKLEARGYQVSRCSWPAGARLAAPPEGRASAAAVVSGLLKVTIDGESAVLTAGDLVYVPRHAARRIEVVGTAPVQGLEGLAVL